MSFVAELAGGDEDLRRRVEALLEREAATAPHAAAAAAQEETAELAAGTMLAHYRIDSVLGRGGMGIVYRATDTKLGRPVAIKLLSAGLADPAATRRFRTEAQTASSLNHPHIVTVHDVGEHLGAQYIVSELVDGGTLEDWASATRRRTWRQSVELMIGVADAISAAHAAQVLHRDIKPGNILIGANGYAKLADFGLAKLVEPQGRDAAQTRAAGVTRPGVVVGTVAYMSPEQVGGLPLDARSDVFSFGIVLYELLAGRRPFEGATDLETLKAIAHATPDPLPDGIPEALRIAVDKALEKEPAERYQTMRELVVDLRRVVRKSGSSQTALPASDARIVAGVVKRNPLATLAAAAAIVLAIGAAMYLVLVPETASRSSARGARALDYDIMQLTTTGRANGPAISPDGRFVVYAQRPESGGLPNSLWTYQIATSSTQRIVPEEAGFNVFGPTVTPDAEYVDFIRQDAMGVLDIVEFWRAPFLGGRAQRIVENVRGPVGWSPDRQRMAFLRHEFATSTSLLVVARWDGTVERELARRELPESFPVLGNRGFALVRPAWSPDGNTIAMFVYTAGDSAARVVFIDVATGEEQVRDAHATAEGLAWLDPTTLVLSQSEAIGRGAQLWTMSYPDGAVTPFTNDLSSYVGVDVDAQRRNLVTLRRERRVAISIGNAAGKDAREVVPPVLYGDGFARVAWHGERLIYDSAVNGRRVIAAIPIGGGAPENLATDCSSVAATSNGDTIVCVREGAGLWRVDGRGGRLSQVLDGDATFPLVLPDDQTVLFMSSRSGTRSLWTVPIDGGEPTQIVRDNVVENTFDVSRDGRRLVFLATAGPMMLVCDMPDCANRRTHPVPANAQNYLRWSVDGEHLVYLELTGRDLWSLPLDGGPPLPLGTFVSERPATGIAGFSWSPDGTRLAVAHATQASDVVLLNLRD